MRRALLSLLVMAACAAGLVASADSQRKIQNQRSLTIDMHMHAYTAEQAEDLPVALCAPMVAHLPDGDPSKPWREKMASWLKEPTCPNPIWSPSTAEEVMGQTIAVMERNNILGALSGSPETVRQWRKAAPGRFIPALRFQIGGEPPPGGEGSGAPGVPAPISVEEFRRLAENGDIAILGEVLNQYAGVGPDDPRFEPYLAVAEELDIPVAIHMAEGPPGAAYFVYPKYRARLTSPFLLEEVLIRHPRLRVYVMHYGSPLIDEMIAMLLAHPQLYVDLGGNQWMYPRAYFYGQLKQLVDAGFAKRIMFGSDQMFWPGVMEATIAITEEAPFLSEEQKRDIFCRNAARFLRLGPATCDERPKEKK
ncbi:MAG: amidohydrolase family protein [Candidatus Acidiferrales bacterium]